MIVLRSLDLKPGQRLFECYAYSMFETKRLILRNFEKSDFSQLHSFVSDPQNVEHMDWGPNTESDTKSFLEEVEMGYASSPRTAFELAVVTKDTLKVIGSCGIRIQSTSNRHGDFGYVLNKVFWRQGFGQEIANELLRVGFEELKLHRIWATCAPGNIASIRLLEKIGMAKEGHLRQNIFHNGRWRDSLLFSILRPE